MELYRSMKEISYLWVEKGGGARGGVWELCHQKFNLLTTPGARCPGQKNVHLLASLTYTGWEATGRGGNGRGREASYKNGFTPTTIGVLCSESVTVSLLSECVCVCVCVCV